MKLSFYARGDVLVPLPGRDPRPQGTGAVMASGPPAKYVARDFVPALNLRITRDGVTCDQPAKYICSDAPYSCDSDSDAGRRIVRHMSRKRCRKTGDYPLWPADQATADYLGIEFVPVSIVRGEAVPQTQKQATPGLKKASAGKASD